MEPTVVAAAAAWPLKDIIVIFFMVVIVVFNIGGFFYLTRNHMKHVNDALIKLEETQAMLTEKIAKLDKKLSFMAGCLQTKFEDDNI